MTSDVRLGRILGLPAILGERMVGHVERAVLEQDGRHLKGLTIRRGLGGARWVNRDDVSLLGDVSVILDRVPGRMPRDTGFSLRTVKDESGLTLGWVTDLWVSPETMKVTALEITLGLMEELRKGRLRVEEWTVQPGEDGNAQVLLPRTAWEVNA